MSSSRKKTKAASKGSKSTFSLEEETFVTVALVGVETIARKQEEFSTDEVWLWLAVMAPWLEVPEPRAMGNVMRAATKKELCSPSNRTKKSNRGACHGRPVRIWKSLVRPIDTQPMN